MEIRPAIAKDIDKIIQLYEEFVNYLDNILGQEPVFVSYKNRRVSLIEFLKNKQQGILVIKEGDDIVVFCSFMILLIVRRNYEAMHVEDFFITEEHRGLGLGQKVFQELIDLARTKNISQINLNTNLKIHKAQKFYKKIGGDFDGKRYTFNLGSLK